MRWLVVMTLVLLVVISVGMYAGWAVTCPYCHNSDANVKGSCVLRQQTGDCSEDYYPAHANVSSCRWCDRRGRMSRIAAWMD